MTTLANIGVVDNKTTRAVLAHLNLHSTAYRFEMAKSDAYTFEVFFVKKSGNLRVAIGALARLDIPMDRVIKDNGNVLVPKANIDDLRAVAEKNCIGLFLLIVDKDGRTLFEHQCADAFDDGPTSSKESIQFNWAWFMRWPQPLDDGSAEGGKR